jgi:hypothetical protein
MLNLLLNLIFNFDVLFILFMFMLIEAVISWSSVLMFLFSLRVLCIHFSFTFFYYYVTCLSRRLITNSLKIMKSSIATNNKKVLTDQILAGQYILIS